MKNFEIQLAEQARKIYMAILQYAIKKNNARRLQINDLRVTQLNSVDNLLRNMLEDAAGVHNTASTNADYHDFLINRANIRGE